MRARISVNRSRGLVSDLLKVGRLVVDDETLTLRLTQEPVATVVVHVEDGFITDDVAAILIDFLRPTASAGVRVILEYASSADFMQFDVDTLDDEPMMTALD